jgi:hypothetical protein
MGKADKLSPSPIYSKSGSKRTTMILEAARGIGEKSTRQLARENTAMTMDETIETHRETTQNDENRQTVTNQRSSKIQKIHSNAQTTTAGFFRQKLPQDSQTGGVHS